jgi:hypothetical protein
MCGKKTSWIQLKHIVEQLLGYAHVCATEFGPGLMTRWFLAWSFQRPTMQSPLAQRDEWSFQVNDCDTTSDGPSDQVACRIQAYCDELSSHGRQLKVTMVPTNTLWHKQVVIQEVVPEYCTATGSATSTAHGWIGDDTLPERLQRILQSTNAMQRACLLPREGHFQIVLSVKATTERCQVQVDAQAYVHTRYGKKRVETIKLQMTGEVCRTNRKWRRKVKRLQQAPQVMDVSS